MHRGFISVVLLAFANVPACKARVIPAGEYCSRVSGNIVSKLVSSPSGTASVHLAGRIANVNIRDSSYTVDASTGRITFDAMEGIGNTQFPYILHKWSLEYSKTDVVRMLIPHRGDYISFTKGACHSVRRQLQPGGGIRSYPHGLFRKFCTAEGEISEGVSGQYDLVNSGSGGLQYSAELVTGRVTVALHNVGFKLLKVPNKEVYWVKSDDIDDMFADLNYPYLDYNMRIHYNEKQVLEATRGLSGQQRIVLSRDGQRTVNIISVPVRSGLVFTSPVRSGPASPVIEFNEAH